jgi:toxin ParE1/3/4
MSIKPVLLRRVARTDMRIATAYYAQEAGARVADDFASEIEIAYRRLQTNPGIGSPRYEHELQLPGLRALGLGRFPYLMFYMDYPERLEIVRVIHAQSDIRLEIFAPQRRPS